MALLKVLARVGASCAPATNWNVRSLRRSALPSAIRLPEQPTIRFNIIVGVMISPVSSVSAVVAPALVLTPSTTASRYPCGSPHTNAME
ncbi:hypothetical protein P3T76_012454 [Phytophthora citrophthora]|uniref:Uncharacterized protein n=1 Tax=Phytophthora citrophthora TaxID=4793 RepID=A0AAD9G4K0_9STRA|nr:hypothetical protein P3T76_012454 [Phytophthora citrophthora]